MNSRLIQYRASILFWIFVIITVPSCVLLLAYASGYRYIPNRNTIIQTAVLRVETIPKHASVLLNGNLISDRTPFILDDVLPNIYTVEIQKEGYRSWKKELRFEKGKSVIIAAVILFSETQHKIASGNVILDDVTRTFQPIDSNDRDLWIARGFPEPELLRILSGPETLIVDPVSNVSQIVDDISTWHVTETIPSTIIAAQWNADNELLYALSHEVWVYQSSSSHTELFMRQEAELHDVIFLPDNNYIVFADRDGVTAMERDARDVRQFWRLSTLSDIQKIYLGENKKTLRLQTLGTQYDLTLY